MNATHSGSGSRPARRGVTRRGALRLSATTGLAAWMGGSLSSPAPAAAHAGPFDNLTGAVELPPATDAVTPFKLRVHRSALTDLHRRLAATRWPERETVDDRSQGPRLSEVRALAEHWLTRYDWRRVEARLNRVGQYRTRIDGLGIHFLHVRSRHTSAIPLLLTHGWPGSVVEFLDVIGPLTDPPAYGGSGEDAFDVVVPSLPGFGFSDKPAETGWGSPRIARAWETLMDRLGYDRYLAQGGDFGAVVSSELAKRKPAQLLGVHLNFFPSFVPPILGEPSPEEQDALARIEHLQSQGFGFISLQSTRPQQVGYGLTDSPTGQAAWIYEKFADWTDSDGNPESVLGNDRMLDDIMLYWLPATAASSARIYWEDFGDAGPDDFDVPVGYTNFPGEIIPMPRVWAERLFGDTLAYYGQPARGGHFAAFEQPGIFTSEVRAFGRLFR